VSLTKSLQCTATVSVVASCLRHAGVWCHSHTGGCLDGRTVSLRKVLVISSVLCRYGRHMLCWGCDCLQGMLGAVLSLACGQIGRSGCHSFLVPVVATTIAIATYTQSPWQCQMPLTGSGLACSAFQGR